ncbi:MAG: hypothetical protein JWM16_4481, partial [Verrucomicrobiales bacterium]|nr:hypothetical protein [Verrucomicrobiales bacterium]
MVCGCWPQLAASGSFQGSVLSPFE